MIMVSKKKVTLSERVVQRRAGRFLLSVRGMRLVKNRLLGRGPRKGELVVPKAGRYYVCKGARVVERRFDLKKFVKRYGIVAPHERVEWEK
jgi:hypothetical protein